jgi:inhibitor of cysteine peptidase
MKYFFILCILCFSVLIISCEENKTINTGGRISFINLEGGFYGIYGDDGNKYDPVNLPTDFQKDSLRVIFEGTILSGQSSTHMWGKLFEIKHIELLR